MKYGTFFKITLIILLLIGGKTVKFKNTEFTKTEFNEITYKEKKLNYYVIHANQDLTAVDNLVIYLHGSSLKSVLGVEENGILKMNAVLGIKANCSNNIDFLAPENTFFIETFRSENDNKQNENVLKNYNLDDRILSAKLAIDEYLDKTNYKKIILFGYSEGALIAGRIYNSLRNKNKITVILIGGNGGYSQYKNFKILKNSRLKMNENYRNGFQNMDKKIAGIKADPDSVKNWWLGWPYRRWSTFLFYSPAEDLIKIDIPIINIHGDADINCPVESSRYLKKEFKRKGKNNLTYNELKGRDHGLNNEFIKIISDEINNLIKF